MRQEQVDRIFRDYQQMVGRCAYLKIEIERTKQALEKEMAGATPLDFMKVSSSFVSVSKGTHTADPTGDAAEMLADGEPTEQARYLQARILALKDELEEKLTALAYVDAWLQGLKNAEQFVLKHQMVEHMTWDRVARDYELVFGEQRSVDTLKKVKRTALKKVYIMAG